VGDAGGDDGQADSLDQHAGHDRGLRPIRSTRVAGGNYPGGHMKILLAYSWPWLGAGSRSAGKAAAPDEGAVWRRLLPETRAARPRAAWRRLRLPAS
jgi:hypothetical protein